MNTIRELKQQEKYSNMLKKKNKEKNIYKNRNSTLRIEKMNLIKAIERKDKEIERLNNIIYTTLEYVDREEINSIGTPYTYTERGKHIKELLEGERTFNSLWQENKRLNNIIKRLETDLYNMYITFGEFSEEYTENKIKELKGESNEEN